MISNMLVSSVQHSDPVINIDTFLKKILFLNEWFQNE